MVIVYEFGQIFLIVCGRLGGGSLFVFGSVNVGEFLRGYLIKYDCLSVDINFIGFIDKVDLKCFIVWVEKEFDLFCFYEFLMVVFMVELEFIIENYVQSDEVDMGMMYEEFIMFGCFCKFNKFGLFVMFQCFVYDWSIDWKYVEGDIVLYYMFV